MDLKRAKLNSAFHQITIDLQQLIKISTEIHGIQLDKFSCLVEDIKSLSALKGESQLFSITDLSECVDHFRKLKQAVYEKRLGIAKEFIEQNKHLIKVSSFELMEHDYRENTHSNILRYILDSNFCGESSIDAIYNTLTVTHKLQTDSLKAKLSKMEYIVLREYKVESGRIDLLIKDEKNKFVIIIENKLLSNVGEREFDAIKNTSTTQLDVYTDHFEKSLTYTSWEKYYILLNLNITKEFSHKYFKTINYRDLFQILNNINFNDPIVQDYKRLLFSIINNLPNKIKLKELFDKVQTGTTIHNLNILETIQHYKNGYEI